MSVIMINNGGNGTGVPFGQGIAEPATAAARVRRGSAAVGGDLPARRAGVHLLTD